MLDVTIMECRVHLWSRKGGDKHAAYETARAISQPTAGSIPAGVSRLRERARRALPLFTALAGNKTVPSDSFDVVAGKSDARDNGGRCEQAKKPTKKSRTNSSGRARPVPRAWDSCHHARRPTRAATWRIQRRSFKKRRRSSRSPPSSYRLPTADCRLPTADCRLPTADCYRCASFVVDDPLRVAGP
jgi:hypothetical protein